MVRRIAVLLTAALAFAPMVAAQDQRCEPCLDVAPPPAGDGVLGIGDVVKVLRFAALLDTPSPEELRRADVAPSDRDDWAESVGESPVPILVLGNDRIEVADVVGALRVVVGLDTLVPLPEPQLLEARPDETCLGGLFSVRGRGLVVGDHVASIRLGDLPTELLHAQRGVPMGPMDLVTVRESSGRDPDAWTPARVDAVATTRVDLELTLPDATTVNPRCWREPLINGAGQGFAYAGGLQRFDGWGLACVDELRFEEPLSGEFRAATLVESRGDNQLWVLVPQWPGEEIVELTVIATSACGEGSFPGFMHLGDPQTAVPHAAELLPAEGPAQGGNMVRIVGSHLHLVDRIEVGGAVLGPFDFLRRSWDEILVPILPGSGLDPWVTVAVDVVVSAGASADPAPPQYTYLGGGYPDCGAISPIAGSTAGGEQVVVSGILGAELDVIDEVRFGGLPGSMVIHPNESLLAVTTPPRALAESVPVELLRDGEVLSTCPLPYTYR